MGGEKMKGPLAPHESPTPQPAITLEEFREQYTDEMRAELLLASIALQTERRNSHLAQGHGKEDAERMAHADNSVLRRAMQLIAALHPPSYTW